MNRSLEQGVTIVLLSLHMWCWTYMAKNRFLKCPRTGCCHYYWLTFFSCKLLTLYVSSLIDHSCRKPSFWNEKAFFPESVLTILELIRLNVVKTKILISWQPFSIFLFSTRKESLCLFAGDVKSKTPSPCESLRPI